MLCNMISMDTKILQLITQCMATAGHQNGTLNTGIFQHLNYGNRNSDAPGEREIEREREVKKSHECDNTLHCRSMYTGVEFGIRSQIAQRFIRTNCTST